MICKDVSFASPEENILFDEVLFELAEKGNKEESIRFWESDFYFVVLGRIGKIVDDVNEHVASIDRIPILRRSSGGGTVLQGPGCLNYSLVLSKEKTPVLNDLRKSYSYILARVTKALNTIGINSEFHPISDIALKDNRKKFSGNAQKRGRHFILHHGTILYRFDLGLIEKYLRMPKDMPEYREKRSHLDFVTNIEKDKEEIKGVLKQAFKAERDHHKLSDQEQSCLKKFLETKMYRALAN